MKSMDIELYSKNIIQPLNGLSPPAMLKRVMEISSDLQHKLFENEESMGKIAAAQGSRNTWESMWAFIIGRNREERAKMDAILANNQQLSSQCTIMNTISNATLGVILNEHGEEIDGITFRIKSIESELKGLKTTISSLGRLKSGVTIMEIETAVKESKDARDQTLTLVVEYKKEMSSLKSVQTASSSAFNKHRAKSESKFQDISESISSVKAELIENQKLSNLDHLRTNKRISSAVDHYNTRVSWLELGICKRIWRNLNNKKPIPPSLR